ncbi:MAG: winged helix-turn-helix domain-containing protein [Planctomycetota bacterium]|nr:winged helix-turn-helix domain-containing protein [Planctomycetota bacterium]
MARRLFFWAKDRVWLAHARAIPCSGSTSAVPSAFLSSLAEPKAANASRFSHDQLPRLLHREGFSVQRPKHTIKCKRDEPAYEKAKNKLMGLEQKRSHSRPGRQN